MGIPPEAAAAGIIRLLSDATPAGSPAVYWRHGAPHRADPQAVDAQNATRLWELSARMCGLKEN
jgi:hypothetical protein